jgi:hypothetical protein
MITINRDKYILLLSYNPCEIFDYFNVDELHGLNKLDCENHINNTEQAYIAGLCNLVPNKDEMFVFINLSRCTDHLHTAGLIFHELMHLSFWVHDYNIELEEEIITYAENEGYEVVRLVYELI